MFLLKKHSSLSIQVVLILYMTIAHDLKIACHSSSKENAYV
ncbi:hypothetical protein VINE108521_01915 [Vibrio neonatus]